MKLLSMEQDLSRTISLALLFGLLVAFAGCAYVRGVDRAQAFIDCIDVGMQVQEMSERCVPQLEGTGVYLPDGRLMAYTDITLLCTEGLYSCEPKDLKRLLHASDKIGPSGPSIKEPSVEFIRFGFFGVGDYQQRIKIFHDEDSGKIIGWISDGVRPVRKR